MTENKDERQINWKTISEYVDVDTGEIISKENAVENYTIVTKKIKRNVHRTTGLTTVTNECRRKEYKQITLF